MSIFYDCVCGSETEPMGGTKVIYQHVDSLNEAGIEAYVVHYKEGFRCRWFDNKTAIAYCEDRKKLHKFVGDNFYVATLPGKQEVSTLLRRCVIFNQACYMTFSDWGVDRSVNNHYLQSNISAVITVSEDSYQYLKLFGLSIPVYRMRLSVDPGCFYLSDRVKKNQLVVLVNKNYDDIEQVVQLLRMRTKVNDIEKYKLVFVENYSERKIAETLRESKFFLSFAFQESFYLPSLEAMKCGCVVIGYAAGGGKEYLRDGLSFPVAEGDIRGYVSRVESVLRMDQRYPERIAKIGKKAAGFVDVNYGWGSAKRSVVAVWRKITQESDY